jgi:hypothetical protein
MRRLLVSLLLAHVVASYGVVAGMTWRYGPQGAEILVVAPVWAASVVWEVTANPLKFPPALKTLAAVDGSYVLCFAATLAWRFRPRGSLHSRRRRQGLCTECGYDLTGNQSGTCPECGTLVSAKARLLVRRRA